MTVEREGGREERLVFEVGLTLHYHPVGIIHIDQGSIVCSGPKDISTELSASAISRDKEYEGKW